MYRYSACEYPFPHRITGDGYQNLMHPLDRFPRQYAAGAIWDEEEVEYLIELYKRNFTFDFIADMLERPIDGVRSKVRLLCKKGLLQYRGRLPKILGDRRKQYIGRNYPKFGLKYCARHLGRSVSTVEIYVKQMGL